MIPLHQVYFLGMGLEGVGVRHVHICCELWAKTFLSKSIRFGLR